MLPGAHETASLAAATINLRPARARFLKSLQKTIQGGSDASYTHHCSTRKQPFPRRYHFLGKISLKNTISIVVPIFNEAENLPILYQSIVDAMTALNQPFELLMVDDGSTDGSCQILEALAHSDQRLQVITFRRNYGQTAALMAGFEHAQHEIIVTLDGDLQNDPGDIGLLLEKLDEGFDVVSGWRKHRQDAAIRRNWISRIANRLISRLSGVHLHDYGCTLKAYRKTIMSEVRLYGEMHRFIPIYAHWKGAKVCEIPVRHHPRQHGQSKYGLGRIHKVILDLLTVKFLVDFQTRPIHIFGTFGLFCIGISVLVGFYAVYLRFFHNISFILTPLPLLVVMTFITGILCILLGLIAELLIRIYYDAPGKHPYVIKNIHGHPPCAE